MSQFNDCRRWVFERELYDDEGKLLPRAGTDGPTPSIPRVSGGTHADVVDIEGSGVDELGRINYPKGV